MAWTFVNLVMISMSSNPKALIAETPTKLMTRAVSRGQMRDPSGPPADMAALVPWIMLPKILTAINSLATKNSMNRSIYNQTQGWATSTISLIFDTKATATIIVRAGSKRRSSRQRTTAYMRVLRSEGRATELRHLLARWKKSKPPCSACSQL